jgi:hypothetical protein
MVRVEGRVVSRYKCAGDAEMRRMKSMDTYPDV